jgi:hypothetical protein
VAEHTDKVRAVYSAAIQQVSRGGPAAIDYSELGLFHDSLIALGCKDGKAHSMLSRRMSAGRS